MNRLGIAATNFLNDIRTGDGFLVLITQVTLAFFLLTLTFTSASVQSWLKENLNNMLGADLVIVDYQPLTAGQETLLREVADDTSRAALIQLTLTHNEKWQAAQLKLVDDAYPLQGQLQTSNVLTGLSEARESGPATGEIWLDSRLFTKLVVEVGDQIMIKGQPLVISAMLQHEPDRIMEGHSVAMRAMASRDSFPTTAFDGDRIQYRYLFSASPEQASEIETWIKENRPAAQILKRDGGTHPLATFWKRTENFLGLASTILFFMAAVAIDMTNRRHIQKQKKRLSLYLSFGTKTSEGFALVFIQWLYGFVLSLLIALALAWVGEGIILQELQEQFSDIDRGAHLQPALKMLMLIGALLFSYQVPMFLEVRKASVVGLIQQYEDRSAILFRLVWNCACLALLVIWYSDNMLLSAMTLAALASALLLMACTTWIVLHAGALWGSRRPGLLPFVFFMMKQRLLAKTTQILGLGLCCLLLLFTLMLMKDLGSTMERHARTHDGNLIISIARADQLPALESWAAETGSHIRQMRPFSYAKLVRINDLPFPGHSGKPSDSLAVISKPVRLSWSYNIPANNTVSGGTWWEPGTEEWQQISVEEEVMTDLGLEMEDRLTFQIGEGQYNFQIRASHVFKPGSGSVTFWFQVPESTRQQLALEVNHMGSMELPENAWPRLGELWRDHPSLGLVPLRELTKRFDDTLAIVTKLTVGFAGMILLMAVIVLAASIKGFESDDRRKNGLLMSMGLMRAQCLKLAFYDWLIVALISSLGAIAGTWIAGHLIYQSQFSIGFSPDPVWSLMTMGAMSGTVCLVGLAWCRQSLKASVKDLIT